MNHRLVHMCVNRCKRPADGDILLPLRTACVIGTTDVFVPDPDQTEIRQRTSTCSSMRAKSSCPGFDRRGRCTLGRRGPCSRIPRRCGTRRHALACAARPLLARGCRRLSHHHGRQDHHLPPDGEGRRCGLSAARWAALVQAAEVRSPVLRATSSTRSATAWPLASRSRNPRRSSASVS